MSKVQKANCEKCKHCQMITAYGDVYCDVINVMCHFSKPKRCAKYEKRCRQ